MASSQTFLLHYMPSYIVSLANSFYSSIWPMCFHRFLSFYKCVSYFPAIAYSVAACCLHLDDATSSFSHVFGWTENQCYRRMGRSAVKSSTLNFPIFPVVAGDMVSRYGFQTESIAPSPALAVSEPTISYLVPVGAPTETSATQPSAATRLSTNVSASMMLMMFIIMFLSRTKL